MQTAFPFVCLFVASRALGFYQISSSDIFSKHEAKRLTGDSSSTHCGVPRGTIWTLQAEVLSIPPLQAAQETRDEATVSLGLSADCWASAVGWAAAFTGACANQFSISESFSPHAKAFFSPWEILFPPCSSVKLPNLNSSNKPPVVAHFYITCACVCVCVTYI